jgi:hypothetical protein
VAFEVYGQIQVGHTDPGGTAFTFSPLPTPIVASDDIAAVTAFPGRIGVMWSDQKSSRDWFAWRDDLEPIDAPWHIETAYGGGVSGCTGGHCADDHINLKVAGDEVYAAIKTNLDNTLDTSAPQIVLLRRAADGTWSGYPVSPVSQRTTRPIVLLAPALDRIWVFAKRGSGVNVWESLFSTPGFNASLSHRWTTSSDGTINDPTSTKQIVTPTSGVVVETSLATTQTYWHNAFLP